MKSFLDDDIGRSYMSGADGMGWDGKGGLCKRVTFYVVLRCVMIASCCITLRCVMISLVKCLDVPAMIPSANSPYVRLYGLGKYFCPSTGDQRQPLQLQSHDRRSREGIRQPSTCRPQVHLICHMFSLQIGVLSTMEN